MTASVAFLTGDFGPDRDRLEPNGCAYYRMYLPSEQLKAMGWDVGFGLPASTPTEGFGLASGDGGYFGWPYVVLKLMMHESVPGLIEVMQGKGQRVIIDVDDFHYGISDENIAARVTNPNRNPNNNRMFYEMGIRAADTVIVSTEFLANFYSARCRDVRIVRNSIDSERYTQIEQPETPVIGWVGATPWRSRDVETLREWLPQFVADHGLRVHHSGHIPGDSRHFAVRAGLRRVSTTMMESMSRYPSLLTHFHIGLVPLSRSDFNESKSFLKGLEYAAAGIPFIASPTAEYRLLHEAGVGRLASTPDEWRDHATALLDVDVRRAEAARNLEIVRREFDVTRKGSEWATAILS